MTENTIGWNIKVADAKEDVVTRAWERSALIPGRSLTRSKAPGAWYSLDASGAPDADLPRFAQAAKGCRIQDEQGTWYIDMLCGLGAISFGYDDMPTYTAGQVMSLPSLWEGRAAEIVLAHVAPWAKQVRFTKTGSEATHGALMVARRATGRRRYARLLGSYHGWHSEWQQDYASDAPDVCWYSVGDANLRLCETFADCAAVFVEPPRFQRYTREWLVTVMVEATKAGALVVFDEMIYGGRWALGGASEYFGLTPDIACYGKALANGASVACLVGTDALRDHGDAISGTFSGDPTPLRALHATITRYVDTKAIDTLWKRGRQLQRGLRALEAQYRGTFTVEGEPVHQRLVFADARLGKSLAAAMARRGVLWHPACANVMAAHTTNDIETVVCAAEDALAALL